MAPPFVAMALALRALAPACPAQPACPQNDQCIYTSNGVSLQVACATDYYGGDLQLVQTATLADCLQACAANTKCVAVSYVGQNCYTKSTLESGQSNKNVIGGKVLSRASPSSSAPTPTTTISVTTTAASTIATATASSTPAPTNAIINGGFENADMSVWSVGGFGYSPSNTGRSTVNPRTGKYSFQAQGIFSSFNPFSITLSQTISVVPGKTYKLALYTKQDFPSCVFKGFYDEFPIFADVKFTGPQYSATTAQIPGLATLSGSGVLSITAFNCLGTSVWFDDISLTPA